MSSFALSHQAGQPAIGAFRAAWTRLCPMLRVMRYGTLAVAVAVAAVACGQQEDVSPPPVPTVAGYCVDSVNGDDLAGANDCTCEVSEDLGALRQGTPCRTIAAMVGKVPAGTAARVLLARGSSWRDHVTVESQGQGWTASVLPNGSSVRAYGVGARPILDGADVIPAGLWTKTAGRTHVYQASVATTGIPAGMRSTWGTRIWDNGTILTYVTDVATCDAIPGSWTGPTRPTAGPDVYYVHAVDDSDPATSGRAYEWPARPWGVHGGQYPWSKGKLAEIVGIEGRRNGIDTGAVISTVLVRDSRADRMGVGPSKSPTHAFWNNGIAEDCEANDFISYGAGATPQLPPVRYERCHAFGDGTGIGTGFFFHTGASNVNPVAQMALINCTASDVALVFSGNTAGHVKIIGGGSSDGTARQLASYGHVARLDILGTRFVQRTDLASGFSPIVVTRSANDSATNILGNRLVGYRTNGILYGDATTLGPILFRGNSVAYQGATANRNGVYSGATTASVVVERNLFYHSPTPIRLDGASAAITADHNIYDISSTGWRLGATTYTWAQWQAFPQDANSAREAVTLGGDLAQGTFLPTGGSSATVGAGADAYGDAHLEEWIAAIP